MKTLVLIDDEAIVLDGLAGYISYSLPDYNIVKTFSKSKEALEFLKENYVDVVISDIKMPDVTGIDIAKHLHENTPKTYIILLTAFREFDYAQEAIKANVFRYLTKPVDFEELTRTLAEIPDSINKDLNANHFENNVKRYEFLSDLLVGIISSPEELQKRLENANLNINPEKNPCSLICFHIEDFEDYINNVWKHGDSGIFQAACNLLPAEIENMHVYISRYFCGNIECIAISKAEENESFQEQVSTFCEEYTSYFKNILNATLKTPSVKYYSCMNYMLNIENNDVDFENQSTGSVVSNILSYINENYAKDLSLKELTKIFPFNPSYLSAVISKGTKKTFIEILTNVRMEKAAEFLTNTDYSISSICTMVGYTNRTHFYNLFQKQYGMTPKEYRKQKRI